MLENVYFLLI